MSLIITIIVILILSGVGISITLSVIDNTKQVAFMSKMTAIEEQINLQLIEEEMASYQGEIVNSKITGDNLKLLLNEFNTLNEATKIAILEKREETFDSTKIYTEEEIANLFKLGEDITGDSSYASIYDSSVGAVYKIEPVVIGGKANIGTGKTGILGGKKSLKKTLGEDAITLANAYYFSLVLNEEGYLYGTGQNSVGQLGNGTLEDTLNFVKSGNDKFTKIESKNSSSIALNGKGEIFIFGDSISTPQEVVVEKEGIKVKFKEIAKGNDHFLAIDKEGNIWSWGSNYSGQLGTGDKINRQQPTMYLDIQVAGKIIKFAKISAGAAHSLAIDIEGNIWSWGNNNKSQLGNGGTTAQLTPNQITSGKIFKKISTRYEHSLAIAEEIIDSKKETNLYIWGSSAQGQLGNSDSTVNITTPTKLEIQKEGNRINIINVSAGNHHSLILDENQAIWSSGTNSSGQLGTGNKTYLNKFTIISENIKFKEILSGESSSLAKDIDNNIYTWGANFSGQLGNGLKSINTVPIKIDNKYTKIVTSHYDYTIALDNTGQLWGWGKNNWSQLGNGNTEHQYTPIKIMPDKKFKEIAVGPYHTSFAIEEGTNKLWGWGDYPRNTSIYLGKMPALTPQVIKENIQSIITNSDIGQVFIIDTNNILYGWGYGSNYALGTVNDHQSIPIQISTEIKDVYVRKNGNDYTIYAITTSDALISWGVGIGKITNIPILTNVKKFKIQDRTSMFAITNTNQLYAWGNNAYGKLGTENSSGVSAPQLIMSGIEDINLRNNAAYAMKTNKDLYVWSRNTEGQLGIGSNENTVLTKTKANITIKKVAGYNSTTFIIDNNNKLWVSGAGGILDLDDKITMFTMINSDIEFKDIAYGNSNGFLAIDINGNLWRIKNKLLTKVTSNINFTEIVEKYDYSINTYETDYIKDNNNYLYAIGNNTNGYLGILPADRLVPSRVELK